MMNLSNQSYNEVQQCHKHPLPAMCIPHHLLSITYYKIFPSAAAALIVHYKDNNTGPGPFLYIIALGVDRGICFFTLKFILHDAMQCRSEAMYQMASQT